VKRPCLRCSKLIAAGSYCPACRPSRFNNARGSGGKAATFRRRTLALTGGLCARCGSSDRVPAHHPVPVGVDPSQEVGVPLCHSCHRRAERSR
jgi:hypothetical protein